MIIFGHFLHQHYRFKESVSQIMSAVFTFFLTAAASVESLACVDISWAWFASYSTRLLSSGHVD